MESSKANEPLGNESLWDQLRERFDTDLVLGRTIIFVLFIVATALVLPRASVHEYNYEVGEVWQDANLNAPFDFPILKPVEDYTRQQDAAKAQVPWVFLLDTAALQKAKIGVPQYFTELESVLLAYKRARRQGDDSTAAVLARASNTLSPRIEPDELAALVADPTLLPKLRSAAVSLQRSLLNAPFVDRPLTESSLQFLSIRLIPSEEKLFQKSQVIDPATLGDKVERAAKPFPPVVAQLFKRILAQQLQPTYRFDQKLYEQDIQHATDEVSPYYGKVTAGTLLLENGQRVTREAAQQLASLNEELDLRSGKASQPLMFLGQLMVVAMLTLLTAQFLRKDRKIIYRNNRKTALIFFIIFLMVGLSRLVLVLTSGITSGIVLNFFFVAPLTMAAIMTTIFYDDRVGYFVNILVAVLGGFIIHNNFEFFFVQLCAGSIAIFNLTILRKRSQFFVTAGSLLATYWVAYLGYNFYLKGNFQDINYANLILFAINVIITLATYPLIYLFEKLFQITSDLTYIELLDTDHPLLKELSLKAPGTYQHSLQVASIAESVATKIGANALQVRVGALFHDVGKMYQPDYFIENQSGDNPHDRLDPKVSAEVIINHVAYGEEMTKEQNLPKEIIDFIRTHHGTSRVEFFYRSYQRENPECDENDFRYHGPLPTSKEQAILMMADACEAASRALKSPSAEDLRNLVDNIVSSKINDNQLVLARITFRDVYTIKAEILKILQNIYHTRIEYPEEVLRRNEAVQA